MVVFALFLLQYLASPSIASNEINDAGNQRSMIKYDKIGIGDNIRVLIDGNKSSCVDINGQFQASFNLTGTFKNLEVRIYIEGGTQSNTVSVKVLLNSIHHANVKLISETNRKSSKSCVISNYKTLSIGRITNPTLTIIMNAAELTERLKTCEVEFFEDKVLMESETTLSSTVENNPQVYSSGTLKWEWTTIEPIITVRSESHSIPSATVDYNLQHHFSRPLELDWSTTEPIISITQSTDEKSPNSTIVPESNGRISRTMLVIIVGSSVSVATTIVVVAIIANCINRKLRKKCTKAKDASLFFDIRDDNLKVDLEFENMVPIEENQAHISVSCEKEDGTKPVLLAEGNLQNQPSYTEDNVKDCVIYDSGGNMASCMDKMVENEIYSV